MLAHQSSRETFFLNNISLINETFILWDLVHDANHFKGSLSYEYFMMNKKFPYWMYALEELRVDLATYNSMDTVYNKVPLSKFVKITILFDRLFRFPIFGTRIRNYDALTGQIIFGYLYKHNILNWKNTTLTIDWGKLDKSLYDLELELLELYEKGLANERINFSMNGYHFISQYVDISHSSTLKKTHKKHIYDEIQNDEFPLNQFYIFLKENIKTSWY